MGLKTIGKKGEVSEPDIAPACTIVVRISRKGSCNIWSFSAGIVEISDKGPEGDVGSKFYLNNRSIIEGPSS